MRQRPQLQHITDRLATNIYTKVHTHTYEYVLAVTSPFTTTTVIYQPIHTCTNTLTIGGEDDDDDDVRVRTSRRSHHKMLTPSLSLAYG